MKPRSTTPHPDPSAQADSTKLDTSPAGFRCPKNIMRLPVTSALNRIIIGCVCGPFVCRWGCCGPETSACEENALMRVMSEY